MDVVADGFQISRAAALHHQGLVPAAKEMAGEFVPLVEANRVGAQ